VKLALKTTGGDSEQLGSRVQVMFGAEEVAMSEIGREPGKHPVKVTPLAIPPLQAVHGHGVAQVVATRADAAGRGLEAATTKKRTEIMGHVLDPSLATVVFRKYKGVGANVGWAVLLQPAAELTGQITMKRNPSSPALAWPHSETSPAQIEVLASDAKCLADPQPSAIQDHHQKPVASPRALSASDARSIGNDPLDLLGGKNVRQETRFGRLRCPRAIRHEGSRIVAAPKTAELPKCREIVGDRDWLVAAVPNKPSAHDRRQILGLAPCGRGGKSVEAQQSANGPHVWAAQGVLESHEGHQLTAPATFKDRNHSGTGSASRRRRCTAARV